MIQIVFLFLDLLRVLRDKHEQRYVSIFNHQMLSMVSKKKPVLIIKGIPLPQEWYQNCILKLKAETTNCVIDFIGLPEDTC